MRWPLPGPELCWNVDLTQVKRQICFMWQAPSLKNDDGSDSSFLSTPQLHEVTDDRCSVYPGGTGTLHGRQQGYRCQGKG